MEKIIAKGTKVRTKEELGVVVRWTALPQVTTYTVVTATGYQLECKEDEILEVIGLSSENFAAFYGQGAKLE